mgnify:CR=1 FL=1
MLKIKDLHASVEDKTILKGINLEVKAGEVHAIMGPNGSGKSTLASVIAGKEEYEVTEGEIFLNGENIEELSAEERAHEGVFLSFQYPVEIPGVSVTNFVKTAINETRKAKGLEDMPAKDMLKMIREKSELLEMDRKFLSRSMMRVKVFCYGHVTSDTYSVTKNGRRHGNHSWRPVWKYKYHLFCLRKTLKADVCGKECGQSGFGFESFF